MNLKPEMRPIQLQKCYFLLTFPAQSIMWTAWPLGNPGRGPLTRLGRELCSFFFLSFFVAGAESVSEARGSSWAPTSSIAATSCYGDSTRSLTHCITRELQDILAKVTWVPHREDQNGKWVAADRLEKKRDLLPLQSPGT